MVSTVLQAFSIRSVLEFDTDLKRRRVVGIIAAAILLVDHRCAVVAACVGRHTALPGNAARTGLLSSGSGS